jgi:predicted RNA binding protein YcfA (HicA-like mRNA interferase family)
LPRVTAKELIRVLKKRRFVLVRSSGSHYVYRDPGGNRAVVPIHVGKIMGLKTLAGILDNAGISVEEFIDELK